MNRAGNLRWRVGLSEVGEPGLASSLLDVGRCSTVGWYGSGVRVWDGLVPSAHNDESQGFLSEAGGWSPGSSCGEEALG